MTKLHMGEMTLPEAATMLRNMSMMTAAHSQNWDNLEAIFLQFLTDVYEAGKQAKDSAR